jgi:adenylyl- and sulfurtransferase ThiI
MEVLATKTLLIKPGELMLKGDNRNFFEKKLRDNIKSVLNRICLYDFTQESGRYYISLMNQHTQSMRLLLCFAKYSEL